MSRRRERSSVAEMQLALLHVKPPAPEREDLVYIWSGEHGCYWRADAAGYTRRIRDAGIYTRDEAGRMTSHCGPEKQIEIEPVRRL